MTHEVEGFIFELPEMWEGSPQLIAEWVRCLPDYVDNYKRLLWWSRQKFPMAPYLTHMKLAASVLPNCTNLATMEKHYGNL